MEPTDLTPLALPTGEDDWLDWLTERAGTGLATAGAEVAALKDAPAGDETVAPRVERHRHRAGRRVRDQLAAERRSTPTPAVMEAAEGFQIEARRFTTDLYLDAEVFARLSSLDGESLEPGARRVLELTPARLPARRRRPGRGDPRAAARAEPPRERAVAAVRPGHPRRPAYDAGAARGPDRAARGLPRRPPGRRGRAGRDRHRLPRHPAVPDPRPRPGAAAPRRAHVPQHRLAGQRRGARRDAARCARRRPACWGTPTGRATTPRSR